MYNVFSGVPGGTLVVSEKAVNAYLREEHDTVSFDNKIITCYYCVIVC